jgi:hypothetical protein
VPTQTVFPNSSSKAGHFGPDEIAVMSAAFEQILLDLKLSNRDNRMVVTVAKLVIELMRNGQHNADELAKQVIEEYRRALGTARSRGT